MATEHAAEVVRLATGVHPMQAHILQQALEEEGIVCRVVGDYLEAGVSDIPGLGAEVWVHPGDLERAEKVLQEHLDVPEEETAGEPES